MPNAKVLSEKQQTVVEMTERLKSKSGVFVDYRGIKGIEATEMRAKMREENVEYGVIKNSLMRFAIKNVGFEELDSVLVGTTSLATSSDDPIAPARVIKEYADKLPDYFEIKAGFMDGKILSKSEVIKIASIPPLPMLQAQFLGTLLAPIATLAVVLKAAAEKGGAVEEKVDAVAEAPAKPIAETAEVPAEAVEAPATAEAPAEVAAEAPAEIATETVAEVPAEVAEAPATAIDAPAEAVAEVPATAEVPAEPAAPAEEAK